MDPKQQVAELRKQMADMDQKRKDQVKQAQAEAQEARLAARAAAKAAKEQGRFVESTEAEIVALRTYLLDRDSIGRRITVDFGAGLLGTTASVVQNRAYDAVVAPKAGEKPSGWVTSAKLAKGVLKIIEGGAIYGLGLAEAQQPPSIGDEMQIEVGKVIAQQGTYEVVDHIVDELMAWYQARKQRAQK